MGIAIVTSGNNAPVKTVALREATTAEKAQHGSHILMADACPGCSEAVPVLKLGSTFISHHQKWSPGGDIKCLYSGETLRQQGVTSES